MNLFKQGIPKLKAVWLCQHSPVLQPAQLALVLLEVYAPQCSGLKLQW